MISVLFLCTGNSCRSQIAEALLRAMAGGRCEAASAGVAPQEIHPMARRVVAEIGLSMDGQRSKHVDEFVGRDFDMVITVCDNARQSCPVFAASARREHWPLADPAQVEGDEATRLEAFRRTREELRERIAKLMESFGK